MSATDTANALQVRGATETPRPRPSITIAHPQPTTFEHVARLLRTARHVSAAQMAARLRFVMLRQAYANAPTWPIACAARAAADAKAAAPLPSLLFESIAPSDGDMIAQRAAALAAGRFSYLGREADFSAGMRWHDSQASPLWLFNLHYLGGLVDSSLSGSMEPARRLLASWWSAFGKTWDPVAWHPYTVSLRLMNACVAAGHAGTFEALGPDAVRVVATHAAFLLRHLERDLRGNHLLENACALVYGARFLRGGLADRCEASARRLLHQEVAEQVLADGGHFELSPMYHTLMLQRLLQAIQLLGDSDPLVRATLRPAAARMATFLRDIVCPDGDIPLLGDSARGIAPPATQVLAAAAAILNDLDHTPPRTSFPASGLYVLRGARLWTIMDAGPVCPDYLPGHGQADSLTLEVWCDGVCVVGDPGVHEYTGAERAWGRSSRAHSTITVDDADTSEVYGSFRVAARARLTNVAADPDTVTASLEPGGISALLTRRVQLMAQPAEQLEITDRATLATPWPVRSRLHLHPSITLVDADLAGDRRAVVVRTPAGLVRIAAEHPMRVECGRASRRFGLIEPTTILVQELAPNSQEPNQRGGRFTIEPLACNV